MKKLLAIVMILSILGSLISCGKRESIESTDESKDTTIVEETTEEKIKVEETTTEATTEETTIEEKDEDTIKGTFRNLNYDVPASYSTSEKEDSIAYSKNEPGSLPGVTINALEAVPIVDLDDKDYLEVMMLTHDVDLSTIESFENENGLLIYKATMQIALHEKANDNDASIFLAKDSEYLYLIYHIANGARTEEDQAVIDLLVDSLSVN